ADDKGTPVKFGDLSSTAPAGWVKEEPPASSFIKRFAQFKLPRQGDDKADAYVVVFAGLGGSAKANIDRWKGQMGGGDGKVSDLKVSGQDATRLEIDGTYTGSSLDGKSKPTPMPGARGVFYVFEGADQVYHIRLVGPAKTVKHFEKGYDEWVKGFKK
ncbi:MAG: hypothetical protein ACRC33_12595, partial [Gemmataceae bacterium]